MPAIRCAGHREKARFAGGFDAAPIGERRLLVALGPGRNAAAAGAFRYCSRFPAVRRRAEADHARPPGEGCGSRQGSSARRPCGNACVLLFRRERAATCCGIGCELLEAKGFGALWANCRRGPACSLLNRPLEYPIQINPWRDGPCIRQRPAASRNNPAGPCAKSKQGNVVVLNRDHPECGDDGPRLRGGPVAGTGRADRTWPPPLFPRW